MGCFFSFVGQMGVDLEAHIAIDAAGSFICLPEQIGGPADIFKGKGFIDFINVFACLAQLFDIVIIIAASGNRFFKNGRIRRDAAYTFCN